MLVKRGRPASALWPASALRLSITGSLELVALLHQIRAQRVAVLQLAIQDGAGVLGEVPFCPGPGNISFRGLQARVPGFVFLHQLAS